MLNKNYPGNESFTTTLTDLSHRTNSMKLLRLKDMTGTMYDREYQI